MQGWGMPSLPAILPPTPLHSEIPPFFSQLFLNIHLQMLPDNPIKNILHESSVTEMHCPLE
jgi:hypothetical protein